MANADSDIDMQGLLQKCLGRRICKGGGANYNVANINLPATKTFPSVLMPPLPPKESCKDSLYTRPDDTEETFRHRMEVRTRQLDHSSEGHTQMGNLHVLCCK